MTEGVKVPKDWNEMEIMGNHLLMTEGVEVPKDWNEMEIMGNHLRMTEGVEVPMDWLEMENLEHEALEQLMINLGISEDQELGGVPDDEMLIDVDCDEEMEHSYLDRLLGILPSVERREPVGEEMEHSYLDRTLEMLPRVVEQPGRRKRKRRGCPRSGGRRVINCSEAQYYVEEDYYPTWRCFHTT